MDTMAKLGALREYRSPEDCAGLSDEYVTQFLGSDPRLAEAVDSAYSQLQAVKGEWEDLLKKPEAIIIDHLQQGLINFYPTPQRNPYVPLGAAGPWVVSCKGAVIHDSGGYGMLGFGHAPPKILAAMTDHHVMANIMTANLSQARLCQRLDKEIGASRSDKPFAKYLCMNSGSEAVTVAVRIADINAATLTSPGARYAGKRIILLALEGGFHGRTDRPAQASASTLPKYKQTLASFRDRDNLVTVPINDVKALELAFTEAESKNLFFDCMLMEPVMGEGNPGAAITREFYDKARELTKKMGTLLLVDSIQAGIRAHGCLSICDYPGFQTCDPPDMETYSKALNAGQYPLSVLAMTAETADIYVQGVYGNTMTTNPRALEVACSVLDQLTPEIGANIREKGKEFVAKLEKLQDRFPDVITKVQGTGLLFATHINPKTFTVVGFGQLEEALRRRGIGVIHGGENALRFTPHFRITTEEIDMMIDVMTQAFAEEKRLTA